MSAGAVVSRPVAFGSPCVRSFIRSTDSSIGFWIGVLFFYTQTLYRHSSSAIHFDKAGFAPCGGHVDSGMWPNERAAVRRTVERRTVERRTIEQVVRARVYNTGADMNHDERINSRDYLLSHTGVLLIYLCVSVLRAVGDEVQWVPFFCSFCSV